MQSNQGEVLSQKLQSGVLENVPSNALHGIPHSNRVAFLSMLIAEDEGLLEDDSDNRKGDILTTIACLHDAGRIGPVGPHAKRGAKLAGNMELKYNNGDSYSEEDVRISTSCNSCT